MHAVIVLSGITRQSMDIVKGVRHAPVQLVLLEDSYHMITIDRERRKVNELCINFAIERSLADENVGGTNIYPWNAK